MTASLDSTIPNQKTINVNTTVRADHLEEDLFEIYRELFKGVKKEDLVFQELQEGYINSIYKVFPKNNESRSLIFRTYGMKFNSQKFNKTMKEVLHQTNDQTKKPETEQQKLDPKQQSENDSNIVIFNRNNEEEVMNKASEYGLCQPVYAKYNNGICYGFTTGVTLNGALMLTNDFLNEMSTKLARFHSISFDLPNIKFKTHSERMNSNMGPMFEHMVNIIEDQISKIDEFPYNKFPSIIRLFEMEKKLTSILQKIGMGEIVFCHNDTNQKNIIWNAQTRKLGFIDFEMAMNNYAVMEIGQLFFFYSGHFLVDFNKDFLPAKEYRLKFLQSYLKEKLRLKNIRIKEDEFEQMLLKLYHQTSLALLICMLKIITMSPFFEFQPDLFKNEELSKARKEVRYYCGKLGLSIFESFDEIKDEITNSAEKYLEELEKIKAEI